MFEVKVTNNRASTNRGELLTKGQIGAQVQCKFYGDSGPLIWRLYAETELPLKTMQ